MDPRKKLFVSEAREPSNLKVSDIHGTTSRQLHRGRKGMFSAGLGVAPQTTNQLEVADIAYETKKLPYHFKVDSIASCESDSPLTQRRC